MPSHLDKFRHNADGDLLGRFGVYVYADGCMDLLEQFLIIPLGLQVLVHHLCLSPAPDHADIASGLLEHLAEDKGIVLVSPRENDYVFVAMERKISHF